LQELGQFAVDVDLPGVDRRLDPVQGGGWPCTGDVRVDQDAFVVTELAVTQARDDPAGRSDERVAGGDEVEKRHRPVNRVNRRSLSPTSSSWRACGSRRPSPAATPA
jgi:hypothetical protein